MLTAAVTEHIRANGVRRQRWTVLLAAVVTCMGSHMGGAEDDPAATARAGRAGLTSLDARRIEMLRIADQQHKLAAEDPARPRPNLTLEDAKGEGPYQEKVLAVLGLVDAGEEPRSRIDEANRLLRYALNRWPASGPNALRGQYATVWNHSSRTRAVRLYLLYSTWFDADVREEYTKRVGWLVAPPLRRSSENIRFTNNAAYFLAHEALNHTDKDSHGEVKAWLVDAMRALGQDGPHEWGRNYLSWTMGAILNLSDFAEDQEVRWLATMVVDHYLAQMSGFVVNGNYGSGAIRRWKWTFSVVLPQTSIVRTLFPDCFDAQSECLQLDWAASNYRPLETVARLYESREPHEALLTTGPERWRHRVHRGRDYLIATHQAIEKGKFDLRTGGTHGVVGVFVQSGKGPRNCAFPFGCGVMKPPSKQRNVTERYFGYQNVGFAQLGGSIRAVWAGGGTFPGVPVRLFHAFDFERTIEDGWAFLTDGVTYIAWRPTQGTPVDDPEAGERTASPEWGGRWLRSTYTPGPEGEVCIVEVGDADSFGTFEDFRRAVTARNATPAWQDGHVTYTARDGAIIDFGTNYVKVDGRPVSLDDFPRAKMSGLRDYTVEVDGRRTTFDFDEIAIRGDERRVASVLDFGAQ